MGLFKMLTDEVFTFKEACQYLKISKYTLNKLLKEAEIKSSKVGNQHRFLKEELKRFLCVIPSEKEY